MRNNDENMNHFLHNNNSYLNPNFFNYVNNNHLNNFKSMSTFNIHNTANEQPKKSHSTKGSHNFNVIFDLIKTNNNSIDENMSNDNLYY